MYLLLHYMFYEAILYRILLSSRSLENPPSMICIYKYFEGVQIKPFWVFFPPTVQRIRCFNLLDENTAFSLAVNVWSISTATELGPPDPLDLSRKTALCLYRHESPQWTRSPSAVINWPLPWVVRQALYHRPSVVLRKGMVNLISLRLL